MITTDQYRELVEEVLALEEKLEVLGAVTVITSDGPYAMSECAMTSTVPEQKAYYDCRSELKEKRRIIDAYDTIARFELAFGNRSEK